MDFKAQLSRQLGFLRRSADAYDAGHTDEAIRIAVTVRALINKTAKQVPLLEHLNAMHIQLLSTTGNPPAIQPGASFVGLGTMTYRKGEVGYVPSLGAAAILHRQLPIEDWWSQVVLAFPDGLILTRQKLVLSASDKDGGAHVDARLTPEYAALMEGLPFKIVRASDSKEIRLRDSHLVSLRQVAYEVLNSQELLRLLQLAARHRLTRCDCWKAATTGQAAAH